MLAAFAVFVACAGSGVLCQNDQWIVSGNAQLVEVSLDDLSELSDNNDTLIDSSLPGVMGAHTRKLLSCPAHSSNTPNFISIAAQHYSTLSFGNMNKVGFSLTQEVRICSKCT